MDKYFVCRVCSHFWSEPEYPQRCENCTAPFSALEECEDMAEAEDLSAEYEDANRQADWEARGGMGSRP